MNYQDPNPETSWLEPPEQDPDLPGGQDWFRYPDRLESGMEEDSGPLPEPEPVSPFLDPRLQLGSHALPIPALTEANPVSLQVLSSAQREKDLLMPTIATVLQRGAAKVTDWFLILVLDFALLLAFTRNMDWGERSATISLALLLAIPSLWLTWALYNLLLKGHTLGKHLFGLEVVTDTWGRLSAWRNFGRVWAESLSGGLFGVGYLFALFDPAKRTLHDHLCGTRVILRPPR